MMTKPEIMHEVHFSPDELLSEGMGFTTLDGRTYTLVPQAGELCDHMLYGPLIITGYQYGNALEETGLSFADAFEIVVKIASEKGLPISVDRAEGGYMDDKAGPVKEPCLAIRLIDGHDGKGPYISPMRLASVALEMRQALRQGSILVVSKDGYAEIL